MFYSLYEYESDDPRKKSEIYGLDDLYYKLREVVEFILLEKKNAKRDKSLVILGKKINLESISSLTNVYDELELENCKETLKK